MIQKSTSLKYEPASVTTTLIITTLMDSFTAGSGDGVVIVLVEASRRVELTLTRSRGVEVTLIGSRGVELTLTGSRGVKSMGDGVAVVAVVVVVLVEGSRGVAVLVAYSRVVTVLATGSGVVSMACVKPTIRESSLPTTYWLKSNASPRRFSRLASRHGSLKSLFLVGFLYLPS